MATNNACNYNPTQYTVQVGGASGTLANVGPGSSGQILQSGGASANPAYSTATYPSTAGASGNVLTSNGTNWVSQAPAAGSNKQSLLITTDQGNLSSSTNYKVRQSSALNFTSTPGSIHRLLFVVNGTVNTIYVITKTDSTLSSSQNATLNYVLGTGGSGVVGNINFNATNNSYTFTSLGISVTAGDWMSFNIQTPAWTTTPSQSSIAIAFEVE